MGEQKKRYFVDISTNSKGEHRIEYETLSEAEMAVAVICSVVNPEEIILLQISICYTKKND